MANEISITASLSATDPADGISVFMSATGLQFTMTGSEATKFFQSVGTSEEALELGQDIGTPGFIFIKNHDTTNFVSLRRATGEGNCVKIRAGGVALFELAATAPYVIADTAACRIEVLLLEV